MLAAGVAISEFMADNETTLVDEDGDGSDWIELYNQGTEAVNLNGWSLTDDPNDLSKWRFPDVNLEAGSFLTVFASSKDRDSAGGPLHTNFSLERAGEYLALFSPEGVLSSEFAPAYPPQTEDVSYGVSSSIETSSLITSTAGVKVIVPSDDGQGDFWTGAREPFDDSNWREGTVGVGFDDGGGAAIQPLAYWTFDSVSGATVMDETGRFDATLAGATITNGNAGRFGEALSLDGADDYVSAGDIAELDTPLAFTTSLWFQRTVDHSGTSLDTNHGVNNVLIAQSSSAVNDNFEIGTEGGSIEIYLDTAQLDGPNPSIQHAAGVQNGRWHHLAFTYDAAREKEVKLYFDGELVFESDLWGGAFDSSSSSPLTIGLARPDGSLWGDFEGLIDDVAIWDIALSDSRIGLLNEGVSPGNVFGYSSQIGLDLQQTMLGQNASAYLRVPFTVNVPETVDRLNLRMRYDDGFIAYLNGTEVARRNAPANAAWNSAATTAHDGSAIESMIISVAENLLTPGDNLLAIQGLNVDSQDGDFLIAPALEAIAIVGDEAAGYFSTPTPGALNTDVTVVAGPLVQTIEHQPRRPGAADDILVTAKVAETNDATASVTLTYRVMHGGESSLVMSDDGQGPDAVAADGVYTAVIPAGVARPGEMVRWRLTLRDESSNETRFPLWDAALVDPNNAPEYVGTVIQDENVASQLPILEWFLQPGTESAADTRGGARAALFYDDQLYDNVFVRIRGGSSTGLPKKSYKFDFNPGYHFLFDPRYERVEEININTTYTDKAYIRQSLAFEVYDAAGAPGSIAFPLRLQRNGEFFAVAMFVEQPDERLLRREGLDPDGALYKMFNTFTSGTSGVEKKTRLQESNDDLVDFVANINSLSGAALANYVFDHVDAASVLNHLAATVIAQNNDNQAKNYYVYRDTNGDGEWLILPWDVDLTFGSHYMSADNILDDAIWADRDIVSPPEAGAVIAPSHPYVGRQEHPGNRSWNRLVDALYDVPQFREMYLRRLRSVMDELLQPRGAAAEDLWFETRLDQFVDAAGPDVALDFARWADPWLWGQNLSLRQAMDVFRDQYLDVRRDHLYVTHSIDNLANGAVGIPHAQAPHPEILFGQIEFNPASGDQDQEFIELRNPLNTAVDISGWRLNGGVDFEFPPGVVIPTGASLYVSPNVSAFRARTTGPSGGQGLLVQGGYQGHLSSFGESLTLHAPDGVVISETVYEGDPSAWQRSLRISEINYNPLPPTDEERAIDANLDNDDFEFIELVNAGPDALDLSGVAFTGGVQFVFPTANLAPDQRAVVVRDPTAYAVRYGNDALVLGSFLDSGLDNGGETIKLEDPFNGTIHEFRYDDSEDWPDRADGKGSTLEVIDFDGDYAEAKNWRASVRFGGSPGTADIAPTDGVRINEVLSHTDLPVTDAIELFNAASVGVDISGWYLSDSSNDYHKYRIPDGAFIGSGEYLVFDESDFNASLGMDAKDFSLNGAHGDQVWLLAADTAGRLSRFVDAVEFGAQANGESWGRWPNAIGDLSPMSAVSLGEENLGPRVGPVIFSEIMYQPLDPDGAGPLDPANLEFLEIHNPTAVGVDLTEWRISGGVDYAFPIGLMLDAQETLAIVSFAPEAPENASLLANFRAYYGLDDTLRLIGGFSGKLNNGGETVRLLRPDAPPLDEPEFTPLLLEDEVRYDDELPWPTRPAGQGDSLNRAQPGLWGNAFGNWSTEAPSPGQIAFGPLRVVSTEINAATADPADLPSGSQPTNWARQRSDLSSLLITFNRAVMLSPSDLTLTNLGLNAPLDADAAVALDASQVSVFGNELLIRFAANQLNTGVYQLEISASVTDAQGMPLDGNGDGSGGDAYTLIGRTANGFYRLPSDWNGDGGVTIFDFPAFSYWFGQSTEPLGSAPSYMDLNADGGITIFDFPLFAQNFGESVVFPSALLGPRGDASEALSQPTRAEFLLLEGQVMRRRLEDRAPRDELAELADQQQRPAFPSVPEAQVLDRLMYQLGARSDRWRTRSPGPSSLISWLSQPSLAPSPSNCSRTQVGPCSHDLSLIADGEDA